MKVDVKEVRKMYRLYVRREEVLSELCCSSNIGYPGSTAESRAGEGVGGGGGSSGSRVPDKALDRMSVEERTMDDVLFVMERIPDEFAETLRRDYLGDVEPERARRHRETMRFVALWVDGVLAGYSGRRYR